MLIYYLYFFPTLNEQQPLTLGLTLGPGALTLTLRPNPNPNPNLRSSLGFLAYGLFSALTRTLTLTVVLTLG